MDPTLDPNNQQGMQGNPQAAMQNALMLQALQGGGAQPPAATGAAMGPQQMGGPPMPPQAPMPPQVPVAPVDPSTMTGGLGGQAGMAQPNPIAQALMSQIPGSNQ
jgi:hypothetical protein